MLEEALKRDLPDEGKDVGWRRWSSRETQRHSDEQARESATPSPGFTTNGPRADSLPADLTKSPQPIHQLPPSTPALLSSPQPNTTPESRFFKFRLPGVSRSPSVAGQSRSAVTSPTGVNGRSDASHLMSASLPSLVLPQEQEAAQREVELNEQLEEMRRKYELLSTEKSNLEEELESLSQALFEEVIIAHTLNQGLVLTSFIQANKMVATERIKLAEVDEDLRSTVQEREALKSALKLIGKENDRLRQAIADRTDPSSEENTQTTLYSNESHLARLAAAEASESIYSRESILGNGASGSGTQLSQLDSTSSLEVLQDETELETPIAPSQTQQSLSVSSSGSAEGLERTDSEQTLSAVVQPPPSTSSNTTLPPQSASQSQSSTNQIQNHRSTSPAQAQAHPHPEKPWNR